MLYEASRAIDPARLLNPLNVADAQMGFLAGLAEPPFRYAVSAELAGWRARILALPLPASHPFSDVVGHAIRAWVAMADAFLNRDAESFERWGEVERWEVTEAACDTPTTQSDAEIEAPEPFLAAAGMRQALESAIAARGFAGWVVRWDEVMSARILVESARREVRVNPRASFRQSDVRRLIAHEIDVHVRRAENGAKLPLRMFGTGLPGSLQTEEGLAIYAEERVGIRNPDARGQESRLRRAIQLARTAGFREVWEALREHYGPRGAFTVALRLKRGLAYPGAPGVYAKDAVYGLGRERIGAWLAAGGDLAHLYVGKVGMEHPVGEWLAEGLVAPGIVPDLWR